MKYIKKLLLVLLLFSFIYRINADTDEVILANVQDVDSLCSDIVTNKISLYVIDPSGSAHKICPYTTGSVTECNTSSFYNDSSLLTCGNTKYYNENLKTPITGNRLDNPWTWFGMSSGTITVEGKTIDANSDDIKPYRSIRISNRSFEKDADNIMEMRKSLNSGETIAIRKKLDTAVNPNDYTDLRLVIEYSTISGDIDIYSRNSLRAYVSNSSGNRLNSVKMEDQELIDYYYTNTSITKKYRVTTENLLNNVDSNETIRFVGFRPYEYYHIHSGDFRLMSIKLIGYKNGKKFDNGETIVKMTDDTGEGEASKFNNKLRHDIVNNMIDLATIKWGVKQNEPTLHFYHAYNNMPMTFGYKKNYMCYSYNNGSDQSVGTERYVYTCNGVNKINSTGTSDNYDNVCSSGNVFSFDEGNTPEGTYIFIDKDENGEKQVFRCYYTQIANTLYGLPYTNSEVGNATINTFTSRSTLNTDSSSQFYRSYRYQFPNNYVKKETTFAEETIDAGTNIGDDLYLHIKTNINNEKIRTNELSTNDYIENGYDYFLGSDCGKSTYTSEVQEIPIRTTLYNSGDYFNSAAVKMLGDIEINFSSLESKLRNKGILNNETQFTKEYFNNYYTSVYKSDVGEDNIFKAYALLYPGDIVSKRGHVRMISGKTHVYCMDSANGQGQNHRYTTAYNSNPNYCDDYGGIDGQYSYIIVTEISSGYKRENGSYYGDNNSTSADGMKNRLISPVSESVSNWPLTFNTFNSDNTKGITDIISLSEFSNVYSTFVINRKYTFNELLYSQANRPTDNNACRDVDGLNESGNYIECTNEDRYMYLPFRYKIMDEAIDKDYYVEKNIRVQSKSTISELESSRKLTGLVFSNYMIDGVKYIITNNNTTETIVEYPVTRNYYSVYYDMSDEVQNKINSLDFSKDYQIVVKIHTGHTGYQTNIEDSDGYVEAFNIKKSYPSSISLNKTNATISKGNTLTLTATVNPNDSIDKTVTWTSSDPSVATVNSSGKITAIKKGTATITATTINGLTANCEVTVRVPTTGITISKTSTTLTVGESETLTATVSPSDASNTSTEWTSSNNNIVTVNNGYITGVSGGTATITVRTADGNFIATCEVTVDAINPSSITLNKTSATMEKGSNLALTATIEPTNASNKTITWTSSNKSVATVDSNGVVNAIKAGTATITATTINGLTATCEITVRVSITGVLLNKTSTTIYTGYSETLVATISPNNATNKNVIWTSSDPSVATVDSNGLVSAIKVGTTVITVTTVDGNKTASCNVTVSDVLATQITLDKTSSTIEKDEILDLVATITPDNVTNKTITWTSSNPSVATVNSSGRVEGIKAGVTTITAKTSNNLTATSIVTVKVSVTGVTLNSSRVTIDRGNTYNLIATVSPSDATNKSVTFTSTNPSVATVDNNGLITSVEEGEAVITVTTIDGNKTAMCRVIVGSFAAPVFMNLPGTIEEEGKVLYNLPINMDINEFINDIINNETIEIYDENGNLKTTGVLVTGDRVTYINGANVEDYYDISVSGDVNGDGKITPLDYVKIKNHIMEENTITSLPHKLAADYNNDDKISPLDYVGIKNYIMKGDN